MTDKITAEQLMLLKNEDMIIRKVGPLQLIIERGYDSWYVEASTEDRKFIFGTGNDRSISYAASTVKDKIRVIGAALVWAKAFEHNEQITGLYNELEALSEIKSINYDEIRSYLINIVRNHYNQTGQSMVRIYNGVQYTFFIDRYASFDDLKIYKDTPGHRIRVGRSELPVVYAHVIMEEKLNESA
jgi:hypothetical protein